MAKINISDLTVSRSQLEELSEQELAGIIGGGFFPKKPKKTDQQIAFEAFLALLAFLASSKP